MLGIVLLLVGSALASGVTDGNHHHDGNGADGTNAKLGAGVALAFVAALGVSIYQVLFRHLFGHWKHDARFLAFFGAWVSVWHVLVVLPLLCLSSWVGIETLVLP